MFFLQSFFFSWTADFPFYATNLKIEVAAKKKNSSSSNLALESPLYIRLLWNDKAITLPGCDVWCPIEDAMEILQSGYLGEELLTDTLNSLNELDSILNDALLEGQTFSNLFYFVKV